MGSDHTSQHENSAHTEDHGVVSQEEIRNEFKDIVPRIILLDAPFGGAGDYINALGDVVNVRRLYFEIKSLRQAAMASGKTFEPCKISELPEDSDFNFLVLHSGNDSLWFS